MNTRVAAVCAVLVALLAISAGYLHFRDVEVRFVNKVIHVGAHVMFYLTGMLDESSLAAGQPLPNRWLWDTIFFDTPAYNTSTVTVIDTFVASHNISVRLFIPTTTTTTPKNLPIVLYFHGGGYVIGSPRERAADVRARWLSEAGIAVMCVKYGLAPEHPFPSAVSDSWAATQFVLNGGLGDLIDVDRVTVMGESAGGNLAGVLSLLAKEDKAQGKLAHIPALQVCLFPAFWLKIKPKDLVDPFILTPRFMQSFETLYFLGDEAAKTKKEQPFLFNPMVHPNGLSGVSPAFIVTGGKDILQEEGKVYGERLRAVGVKVVHKHLPTTVHAFGLASDPEHYPVIQQVIQLVLNQQQQPN